MNLIDIEIERWLDFSKKGRKRRASTRAQYAAHVNGWRSYLERRRRKLEDVDRDDVLAFLRQYQTMWARRRALTAIRSLYEALNRRRAFVNSTPLDIDLDEVIADVGAASEAVQLGLFDNGWEPDEIADLTWGRALSLMAHGDELTEKAAKAIRTMAALHFPGRTLVRDVMTKRNRRVFESRGKGAKRTRHSGG